MSRLVKVAETKEVAPRTDKVAEGEGRNRQSPLPSPSCIFMVPDNSAQGGVEVVVVRRRHVVVAHVCGGDGRILAEGRRPAPP
jgi:hypothetical protein